MLEKYLLLDPRYIAYRPAMELAVDAEPGETVFGYLRHYVNRISAAVAVGSPRATSKKACVAPSSTSAGTSLRTSLSASKRPAP